MNGVVGLVCRRDEKLWVEDAAVTVSDVLDAHRIHVVDDGTTRNIVAFDAEITAAIADDDVVTNLLPLSGGVELLVDPTIKPKGRVAHRASQREVAEALMKVFDQPKFGIRSNPRHRALRPVQCTAAWR